MTANSDPSLSSLSREPWTVRVAVWSARHRSPACSG
jgi:hypothetical protein